jgi:transglutaminase-like putative cysteine protease
MIRSCRWLLVLLVGVFAIGQRPATAQPQTEEYWYTVEMQGRRCGHMHARTEKVGGRLVSSTVLRMEVKRGQTVMPIALSTEFVETERGEPVRMTSEKKFGALPTVEEYVFKPDGVDRTSFVAGVRRTERMAAVEGPWLTPMAIDRMISARIAEGVKAGDTLTLRSVEPTSGLRATSTTMRFLDKTTLEVVGRTVPALKWASKNDFMPGAESVEYTDDRGQPLRTEMSMGGIKVVLLRADKALALSKANPPELLESTFIRPDRPIKNARASRRAVFVARAEGVAIGSWPTAGAQTVAAIDEHALRLTIDAAGKSIASKADIDASEFRAPSAMVNSDDPEVLRIKREALRGHEQDSPEAQAEALRRFVHRFITKKNFDVGFASAAETVRTRCGDCTEHAVLLCALLRADGIPARCVSGLVYADGIVKNGPGGGGAMGYHMWTQALLGSGTQSRWVDLDAALSETQPMDASHLAIQTLGLADGQTINALMDILPTLGKLKIIVESVE